ncbi:hypothetical protein KY311_00940 [Candidatus Woesearchaeota archaeon]|nr:hypothetical protein [Candidatus Woesearchaeota archaeon]
MFYNKRFIDSLVRRSREKSMDELLPKRHIFHASLVKTWDDMKRGWRNLFVRTYGSKIMQNWLREYKNSNYDQSLRKYLRDNKTFENQ